MAETIQLNMNVYGKVTYPNVVKTEFTQLIGANPAVTSSSVTVDQFFKEYNDYYGHLAGDDCLRQVGSTLKKSLKRAGDLVARYGGEEFIIVLSAMSQADATRVGEKVRSNIESLKVVHQRSEVSEYVTVSVGIATIIPRTNMIPDSLLEQVDKALYQAKRKGRNRVI